MRTSPYAVPAALAAEACRLLAASEAVIRALHARSQERDLTAGDIGQLAAMLGRGDAARLLAGLDAAERELRACLLAQEDQ
ncbi:MAG: hypothetical protein ACRDRJ_34460 [Streptosporangiaceae bacterium]